jgi:hypothetical protein
MCVSLVLRMFLYATVACGTELPDVLGIKIRVAMLVRESTYLRSSHGYRRRSIQKHDTISQQCESVHSGWVIAVGGNARANPDARFVR